MSGASLASARLLDLSDALDVFGLKVTTSLESGSGERLNSRSSRI
jgi:hypothetical protein